LYSLNINDPNQKATTCVPVIKVAPNGCIEMLMGLLYGHKGQRSVTAPTEIISKERFTLLYSLKKIKQKKERGYAL